MTMLAPELVFGGGKIGNIGIAGLFTAAFDAEDKFDKFHNQGGRSI